jgi:hypothetical protein
MHVSRSIRSLLRTLAAGASVALAALAGGTSPASAEEHDQEAKGISCTLEFSVEAWSLLVGMGRGEGHVRCDNGQEADVVIKSESVGLSAGAMKVEHGKGTFGDLRDIGEIYGKYAASSAGAAAGKTAAAGGLKKVEGEVTLGFYGTGEGGGLMRNWSLVTIERKP